MRAFSLLWFTFLVVDGCVVVWCDEYSRGWGEGGKVSVTRENEIYENFFFDNTPYSTYHRAAIDCCTKDVVWSRVSERCICEHVPGIVLQNRAAHISQPFVRQIARKPQPPIELLIVHFS